jgi:hypothetical protein
LRRIFGPKRDKVTGESRKLHYEELNDLYSWPNIVQVVKSRRMRLAWHVACGGEERHIQGFGGRNVRERQHLGDPGIGERIILRWIFRKWSVGAETRSMWLRKGTSGGHSWMRLWTFRFHKMWGVSWLAENWLASQEGLCCME